MIRPRWIAASIAALGLAGCAANSFYVPPTDRELDATRPFKKTVAVLVVRDEGLGDIRWTASESLESALSPHYVLVDRPRVRAALADPSFRGLSEDALAYRAGKALGADYAVFATVRSSSPLPASVSDLGSVCVQSTANVSMYDVAAEKRAFAGAYTRQACREFEGALPTTLASGQAGVDQFLAAVRASSDMSRAVPAVTHEARELAIEAAAEAMKSVRPVEGEVLEVLSDREVLVNVGSAFGVEPGAWLSASGAGAPNGRKDPRTGLPVDGRGGVAWLKVTKVTSGVSCVAEGSKDDVRTLRAGDKVYGA